MSCRFDRVLSLSGCLWALASACAELPASPIQTAQVYARATNEFAVADFYKPAVATNAGPVFELAPLIIQEVTDDKAPAGLHPDLFGALSVSNGALTPGSSRPTIYWALDSAQINGKSHPRFSYLWCYPFREPRPARAEATSSQADLSLQMQGIRITLDSRGRPAIWEVAADTSGARLIFVSRSLESAAAAEFGKPLPGRRHSIERSIDDAPDVIVPRVIDDGPMALGPIIHLSAGTRDVSTLICRCMAAQTKKLQAARTYDWVPIDAASKNLLAAWANGQAKGRTAFWPGGETENHLAGCLRWPTAF